MKNLQKNIKAHHFIALIGIVVLALAIAQYSGRKTNYSDGFNQAQKIQSQGMPVRGLREVLAGIVPSLITVGAVILV